jgi:membrane protein YdbS with pleckstrin-like domain
MTSCGRLASDVVPTVTVAAAEKTTHGRRMVDIGPIELLIIAVLLIVPIVLDIVIASRKALEPLWLWVLLSVLFPWIMLIVLLIVPARRDQRGAV